jgi:hypothetical protein
MNRRLPIDAEHLSGAGFEIILVVEREIFLFVNYLEEYHASITHPF